MDAQDERIRAYCTLKGLRLVDVIADAGVSGGKPLAQRDGGRRLLETVKARGVDGVVMFKLDRMFRNAGDCLSVVERWDKKGIALHVVDLGGNAIDTTSAAGRFMLVVLAGAAEMERNLTRERTRSALAVKHSNGQRTGTVPYGYDLAGDGVTLTANESEQAILAEIESMRAKGLTLKRIAAALTQRAIPTKTGNVRWSHSSIASILNRARMVG